MKRLFLSLALAGSLSALAVSLCDSGVSREELAELRRLLEEDAL